MPQLEHLARPTSQCSNAGRWSHQQGCRLLEGRLQFLSPAQPGPQQMPNEWVFFVQSQVHPRYTSWRLCPHIESHHLSKTPFKGKTDHGLHTSKSSEGRILNWGWCGPHSEVYSSHSKASSWLIQRNLQTKHRLSVSASWAFVSLLNFICSLSLTL